MPKIDEVLFNILFQLAKAGPSELDDACAVQLFNLRLIDYSTGHRWKINAKGVEHLLTENR